MSEIYALSDDILSPDELILSHAEQILKSGIKLYQYRNKKAVKNEQIARELLSMCENFGAKFIINDDADFAYKIGAKCLHIGKGDSSLSYARRLLGDDAFIGVSCYDSLDLAIRAEQNGANYVAFGAVFPSLTKPNTTRVGLETLKKAKEILKIPVCAIGGIDTSNISQILALNIDYIAIVRAIYEPKSISENLLNLQHIINKKTTIIINNKI
ncbi:thiamine phosphate synthase [Campylobacter mucosalis]|uniref:Thiamine-phosphate synthase n=1 Tax=Campylobacter mucosalis CCUG 21559 TaxID=1032067 RepID=A0A6G5QG08_9BACT|nr:thiamine phosphate synthase [Campylobacter mucosalis]QCD44572.1 thiamine phosphate synthase [Campylobacter mucosalis CCUG 21559]